MELGERVIYKMTIYKLHYEAAYVWLFSSLENEGDIWQ
jgi:hypothetical protein